MTPPTATPESNTQGAPFPLRFLHDLWRRAVPVFIGLFFMWQFWHLLVDNLAHMEDTARGMAKSKRTKDPEGWEKSVRGVPDGNLVADWVSPPEDKKEKPTITGKFETERKFHKWYGQVLGHEQAWSLFAPDVGTRTSFVAVQLRWDDPNLAQTEWLEEGPSKREEPSGKTEEIPLPCDGPPKIIELVQPPPTKPEHEHVLILSDNEPKDIHAYFRWGHFRERRYEGQILVPMHRRKDEKRQDYLDRWTESIRSNVRQERDCMYAYLRWRLREWQAKNPDVPMPTQVLLMGRTWAIPAPPGPQPPQAWDWEFQGMRPIARWLPREERDSKYLPLERYLPSSGYFQKMEK